MSGKPLAGKVAIVTGSGKLSGIGASTAIALAEQGANVRHIDSRQLQVTDS
jgi:NAD(P)-dependent dehydrogenase (short-subunit alcohol dehydrogenase family)